MPLPSHPATAPSWIDKWPSRTSWEALFSTGIRVNARRMAAALVPQAISWDDASVRVGFGRQLATLRLQKDGTWKTSCTCGAPNCICIHTYTAFLTLQVVFDQEGWLSASSGSQAAPVSATVQPPRPTSPSAAFRRPASQLTFRDAPQNATMAHQPHKLEIEVDFQHEPGKATLRFTVITGNERTLATLNVLYNIAYKFRTIPDTLSDWSKEDSDFLKYLFPELQKIQWNNRNLSVLKLPRNDFAHWQEAWKHIPTRFIEKTTRSFLSANNLLEPVALRILLTQKGNTVSAQAYFVSSQGEKLTVGEYFRQLETSPEKTALVRQLRAFQSPIPLPDLQRLFGRCPMEIPRLQLVPRLRNILGNRFDLLEGPIIRHSASRMDAPLLRISQTPSAFVFELSCGRTQINSYNDVIQPPTISDDGRFLTITQPDEGLVRTTRNAIRAIQGIHSGDNGTAELSLSEYNASRLKAIWKHLPPELNKTYAPELKNLIADSQSPKAFVPLLDVQTNGPLSEVSLKWQLDNAFFSTSSLRSIAARASGKSEKNYSAFMVQADNGSWLEVSPELAHKALADVVSCDLLNQNTPVLTRHLPELLEKYQADFHTELSSATKSCLDTIATLPPQKLPELPPDMASILRPYQRDGVQFLIDRAACHVGAILADDMGLGKTLQVLAAINAWRLQAQRNHRPFQALVIAPASVLAVWKQQTQQFCPDMPCTIVGGNANQRKHLWNTCKDALLVTHYQLARSDADIIQARSFNAIILDEAQAIKNPEAQVTLAIQSFKADTWIAVTGTPLENNLLDIWSIMNTINPGLLGTREAFQQRFVSPSMGLAILSQKLRPIILRRNKSLVAKELPPKTEQVITLEMDDTQAACYLAELNAAKADLNNGTQSLLGHLTRLREACDHPQLLHVGERKDSIKLTRLIEQLHTLHDSGHATLVFSQFTSMLDIIAEELDKEGLPHLAITGDTPLKQRQEIVAAFSDNPEPITLLLSLKAAGTGLTLTRADYVFLFDPWWNPAVEQQAIDRTHRIGQTHPVVAYRYVIANSIEEKVMKLLQAKRELFNTLINADSDDLTMASRLTAADLRDLVAN